MTTASKFSAKHALERLRGAREQLTSMRRDIEGDLRKARTFSSNALNAQGTARKQAEMADQARQAYRPLLDSLRSDVQRDAALVEEYTARFLPRLPDTATGLQRAQIAWDQVRTLLEAGKPLHAVIAAADAGTLAAIAEWAPTWIEARMYARRDSGAGSLEAPEVDADTVRRSVHARMAEIGDDDTRWALEARQEAASVASGFEVMAADAARLLQGSGAQEASSSGLEAALAAALASQGQRATAQSLGV